MKCLQALLFVCLFAGPSFAENYLVLPFFNAGNSNTLDWVGESISESIREALASEGVLTLDREAREEGFRRLSMTPYAQLTKASVLRLAEVLDADHVVFGSFELTPSGEGSASKSKGMLRIQAEALNLRKARRGPEMSERGPLEELAQLQSHLAWQALQTAVPERRMTEEQWRRRESIVRVDALESYVRGLLSPSTEQKLKYFTQAVRLQPDYSKANFELGKAYVDRKNYRAAAEALQKVNPEDGRHREASFLLGMSHYNLAEFTAAERAFQTVAQQIPLSEVLNNLGAAQSRLNQPAALASFRKALEGDPADPVYHFNVGYALWQQGELDGAAERFRAVLDRTPDDAVATTMLGRCLNRSAVNKPGKSEGFERLKQNYEESAYWQLKAVLEPKR